MDGEEVREPSQCSKCGRLAIPYDGRRCFQCVQAYMKVWNSKPENKEIKRKRMRELRAKDQGVREREKVSQKAWRNRPENKRSTRERSLWRLYGITSKEYDALFVAQSGLCAICYRDKPLVVDHSHLTGVVRGLLCQSCNTAIGLLGDSLEGVQSATLYLGRIQHL